MRQHSQQSLYRFLSLFFLIFLFFLQYHLWMSDQGVHSFYQLKQNIAKQERENAVLQEANDQLSREVKSLYQGGEAFEYYARMKYGLTRSNEHYHRW